MRFVTNDEFRVAADILTGDLETSDDGYEQHLDMCLRVGAKYACSMYFEQMRLFHHLQPPPKEPEK